MSYLWPIITTDGDHRPLGLSFPHNARAGYSPLVRRTRGGSRSCRRNRGGSRRSRRTWSEGSGRRITGRSRQGGVFGLWSRRTFTTLGWHHHEGEDEDCVDEIHFGLTDPCEGVPTDRLSDVFVRVVVVGRAHRYELPRRALRIFYIAVSCWSVFTVTSPPKVRSTRIMRRHSLAKDNKIRNSLVAIWSVFLLFSTEKSNHFID